MCSYRGYSQAILLSLIVGFSACQPVPRPFQPFDKSLYLDGPTVHQNFILFLGGIEGAGFDLEQRFLTELGVELGKLNILASHSGSGRGNFFLHGRLVTSDDTKTHIYWSIRDLSGDVIAVFEQEGYIGGLKVGNFAQNAATRIQSLLSDRLQDQAEVVVFVPPVDAAPGDGRVSLTSAMRTALVELKIAVTTELRADAASLLGSVVITKQDDADLVEIHWSVIGSNGQEIALVTQSNPVPTGILDGAWGGLAEIIAEAAAQSLAPLIRDYNRNIEESP